VKPVKIDDKLVWKVVHEKLKSKKEEERYLDGFVIPIS